VLEVVKRGKQFLAAAETVLSEPEKVEVLEPKILLRARLINTRSSGDRCCIEENGSDGLAARQCNWPDTAGSSYIEENIRGRLAKTPLLGAAQPGGAELDRTMFFDFGWRPGVRSFTAAHDQGSKQPALDLRDFPGFSLLTSLGSLTFPSRLPVTYLKLGNFSLGALPLEMSTTAGYRIRKDMESSGEVFQLLGLTNGYASYAATASEYAAQDYMGASTLWGPDEAEFFRCQLANLRAWKPKTEFKFPDIPLGHTDQFGAAIIGQKRDLPDEELEEIIRDDSQMPVRHLPFFEWSEHVSRDDKYTAASKRRIWVTTVANEIVDKTDFGFIKILKQAPTGDCQVWNAIWLGPLLQKVPAVDYVFNVETANRKTVRSKPFQVNLSSPRKPTPEPLDGQASCK